MENSPTFKSDLGRSYFHLTILQVLVWLLIFGLFGTYGWLGLGRVVESVVRASRQGVSVRTGETPVPLPR
jgi:hypothetical protein